MKKGGKGGYTSRNVHACLAKATFVVPYFDFGLHLQHQGKLHFLFHYLRFSTWKTRADAEYPGRMSKHVNVVFFLGLLETCAYTSKDPRCALCSRPFFKDDTPDSPGVSSQFVSRFFRPFSATKKHETEWDDTQSVSGFSWQFSARNPKTALLLSSGKHEGLQSRPNHAFFQQ